MSFPQHWKSGDILTIKIDFIENGIFWIQQNDEEFIPVVKLKFEENERLFFAVHPCSEGWKYKLLNHEKCD